MTHHKSTFIVLTALFLVVTSCSSSKDEGMLPYTFTNQPSSSQAEVSKWPATAFVFSQGKCTYIQKIDKLSDLKSIKANQGDAVSVVAYENSDNIGFTSLKVGSDIDAYSITTIDSKAISPKIWYETSRVEDGAKDISQTLIPLTSDVSMTVTNAPSDFVGATLTIPKGTNSYLMGTDSLSDSGINVSTIINAGKGETTIFPMKNSTSEWTPQISVNIGGVTLTPKLTLDRGIGRGMKVAFSLDFTGVSSNMTYKLSCKATDIVTGSIVFSQEESFLAVTTDVSDHTHYQVFVQNGTTWEELKVYDALCSNANNNSSIWNDWDNSSALRDTMSYCIFEHDFSGPVNIKVKKISGSFSSATIRPSTYGIAATKNASNTIQFTLPSYENRKVSVEFDGDRQHNLFIYGNRPDTGKPTASSATVRYFGPGIWNEGTITLTAGQTLYIDYGAIVYGNVVSYGSNVTIAGHGILCGSKMKHWGDDTYSWGDFLIRCNKSDAAATNLTIKDITMIDSPGWNLCVSKTDGVHIDGVNMISWELNGDGIDIVSCKNVEINNCFIRTYDDCISLKCRFIVDPITDVTGVKIHDCLIWNDYARGIVVGPEAGNLTSTGYIHDINVYDCIFLQNARALPDDLRAAFAIGQGSDGSSNLWSGSATPRPITDVTASNLIFDNIAKTGRAVSIRQYGGTTKVNMSRIKLENIKVIDNNGNSYPAFNIVTNGSTISGLTISNFTVNGSKITSTGTQFKIDYPSNVDYTIE